MPLSAASRARSRAAPASNLATAAAVASTGVPSGNVIEAVMYSFSMDGKKRKPVQPPRAAPPLRIRLATPTAAVA